MEKQTQCWPVIIRNGISREGKNLHFILNYSGQGRSVPIDWQGKDLISDKLYKKGEELFLMEWGVAVIEEG